MSNIENGCPIILTSAKGLEAYGLEDNMRGYCNHRLVMPDGQDLVYFMPDGIEQSFVMDVERFIVDEERLPSDA